MKNKNIYCDPFNIQMICNRPTFFRFSTRSQIKGIGFCCNICVSWCQCVYWLLHLVLLLLLQFPWFCKSQPKIPENSERNITAMNQLYTLTIFKVDCWIFLFSRYSFLNNFFSFIFESHWTHCTKRPQIIRWKNQIAWF